MTRNMDQLFAQAATLIRSRYQDRIEDHDKIEIHATQGQSGRRIILGLTDQKSHWLVEFIADVAEVNASEQDAIYLALDFLDAVLAEHLQSGREALPRLDPVPHRFENQTIYLSGGKRRPDLEAQADALLASEDDDTKK